jgi:hypothetical protein
MKGCPMDDAEARAILREHGEEPPVRGRLNPDWISRAEALRADAPAPAPDYDGGVSDADFEVTEAAEPPAVLPERKPRKVRTGPARPSLRERFTKAASGKGKPKRKHPRLSLAPLIGEFWAVLGGMATRVDVPVGRCLQMQAPVAGLVLEDVVKGTIVDTALQPIARAEDKAKAVGALILPPVLVAAIEQAQTLPEQQRKNREAFLMPMLVQSLMMWERVAGDRIGEIIEREKAEAPMRERAEANARLIFDLTAPAEPEPERETVGV